MQRHNLKKNTNNKVAKRVGRGGKRGKTAGRGTKGQNARSGRKKRPEMRDIIKRFPKLRGRGRNYLKSVKIKPFTITTGTLDVKFASGESVNPETLVQKGLINKISGAMPRVKIVAGGDLTKKLTISRSQISSGARVLVEKAGGSIV